MVFKNFINFKNLDRRPRFYLDNKEKAKSFLKNLNMNRNTFCKTFKEFAKNEEFRVLFKSSSSV